MKKSSLLIIFFAMAGFLFVSCDKATDPATMQCKASSSGDTVVLPINQLVPIFSSCASELQAKLISVFDSRCPKGAICVLADRLSVTCSIGSLSDIQHDLGKQKDTTLGNYQYSLTLIDVKPFPGDTVNTLPKKANLRITRK